MFHTLTSDDKVINDGGAHYKIEEKLVGSQRFATNAFIASFIVLQI